MSGSVHAVLRDGFPGPVLAAKTAPAGDTSWIPTQPLIAFAGIANPQRFYKLLERHGGKLVERVSFADHHAFTRADAERLVTLARGTGARLVTTEKDFARMAGDASLAGLAAQTRVLPIDVDVRRRAISSRLGSLIELGAEGNIAAEPSATPALVFLVFAGELVAHLQIALHRHLRRRVRLLQLDTPVTQVGQHDRLAGHRTAHEVARRQHLKLPVKELHFCFAPQAEESVDPVHVFL